MVKMKNILFSYPKTFRKRHCICKAIHQHSPVRCRSYLACEYIFAVWQTRPIDQNKLARRIWCNHIRFWRLWGVRNCWLFNLNRLRRAVWKRKSWANRDDGFVL